MAFIKHRHWTSYCSQISFTGYKTNVISDNCNFTYSIVDKKLCSFYPNIEVLLHLLENRLTENVFPTTPALTHKYNNVFELTKRRHFSIKCTVHQNRKWSRSPVIFFGVGSGFQFSGKSRIRIRYSVYRM